MDLRKAKDLALELMDKHGLFDMRYSFEFNNRKRAAGICSYRRRTIELSKHLTSLADEADVRETILHEIAHALCPRQGHNKVWKAKLIEIGGTGERCYSNESSLGIAYNMIAKYKGTCPNGHTTGRNRKPTRKQSCGKCRPHVYDERYLITWTLNS
jgi:predicted SprT family Zn-dependent metalloprotease